MSSDLSWQRTTLKKAGVTLIDCDHRTPPHADNGYPYIAIPQLKNGHINLDGVRLISKSDYLDWTKKLKPQADDVIVVRRCNSGDSAVVPRGLECAIGQNLVILRADGTKVNPKFLRWLIRGPDWWEQVKKFINVGAVFDSLKCREIPQYELLIPPLKEQKEIATILCALDDRIALLRETNTTLEAIAQALFKSWFVDFDPVRAKQQGREPEGMDAEAAALFPDSFEESELGLVPSGWRVGKVDTVLSRLSAKVRYKKDQITSDGIIPVYEQGGGILLGYHDGLAQYDADENDPAFIFGDHTCVTHLSCEPFDISQNVIPLKGKDRATLWVYYAVKDKQTFQEYRRHWMELIVKDIIIPSAQICDAFAKTVSPYHLKMESNVRQSRTLATLRDTLLPRLISGQLRLPEAKTLLEETIA